MMPPMIPVVGGMGYPLPTMHDSGLKYPAGVHTYLLHFHKTSRENLHIHTGITGATRAYRKDRDQLSLP